MEINQKKYVIKDQIVIKILSSNLNNTNIDVINKSIETKKQKLLTKHYHQQKLKNFEIFLHKNQTLPSITRKKEFKWVEYVTKVKKLQAI